MEYLPIVELFLSIGETFLGQLKNHLPAEVLQAVQSGLDALAAHRNDVITKANLEAQRG